MLKKKIGWSKWLTGALTLVCLVYGFSLERWKKNEIIDSDVVSYYAYLPAGLLFHDLNFGFIKNLPPDFEGKIWVHDSPAGKPVLRMTMGLAFLWIPFFAGAHLTAHLTGASTLGYSWPYSLSLFVAALFYLFVGLFFVRKILLRYFPDPIVSVVLVILVLATNLMYYVIAEPGFTHVYSFALISLFVWLSFKWAEKPGILNSAGIGFLAGLIVLIRPVNITVILFPALVGVYSFRDFWERLVKNSRFILLAAFFAFLVALPQMIYWKMQTGHFLFNSYMEQGKFYFSKPEIINGLFSFRKGWLIYTPVMAFSIAGLFCFRTIRESILPVILVLLLNIYLIFSWWCWWYGGGYGMRTMIDSYGFLAIPLGAVLYRISRIRWAAVGTGILLLLLTAFNQFQTVQYRSSLLHWDSMTAKAYKAILFKKHWPPDYLELIEIPDYDKALRGEPEYNRD